jgi:hypothetical protein
VRSAFFLGAGCSYGTLKDRRHFPPLARDFGSELTKRTPDWLDKYPNLSKVAEHLGVTLPKVSLEELWTCIDYHAKFYEAFNIGWDSVQVVLQLKRSLLRMYGRSCDDDAAKLRVSDSYTLGRIVGEIRPGDTLVSFNYDTLAEQLAKKRGLNLLHGVGPMPEGVVRFAKPHGSASWNLYKLGDDLRNGPPACSSINEPEVQLGDVEPLLLGAVPVKSELIREVQMCHTPPVFDVVLRQWQAVADAVRDADRVVVLGYSFPKEDAYGKFFFHEAVLQRRSKPLRIEYYELREKKEQAVASMASVFPTELCISYIEPVQAAPDSAFIPDDREEADSK